jgi:hypothetical protein
MSTVPIKQSVRAAFEFRRLHWRTVAGVLGLVALGGTLNAAGEMSGDRGAQMIGEIVYVIGTAMAYAALMRLAFADEHPGDPEFRPGPQGFQWGKPEWRLLGVAVLILFAYVIAFVMFLFFAMLVIIVAGGAGVLKDGATPDDLLKALGPGGATVLGLLVIAFALGLLYVAVRISLAPAATVARRRISVFDTWALTKGQVWPLLAATLLVSLPSIVAGIVVGVIQNQTGQPTGPRDAMQIAMPGALIVGLIPGLVVAFIQLPLSVGLVAYLFRGLRPPAEAAGLDTRASDALIGAP